MPPKNKCSAAKAKSAPRSSTPKAKPKPHSEIPEEEPPAKRQRRKTPKASTPLPEASAEEKEANKQYWGRYVKVEPAETPGEKPLPIQAPSDKDVGDTGFLC